MGNASDNAEMPHCSVCVRVRMCVMCVSGHSMLISHELLTVCFFLCVYVRVRMVREWMWHTFGYGATVTEVKVIRDKFSGVCVTQHQSIWHR